MSFRSCFALLFLIVSLITVHAEEEKNNSLKDYISVKGDSAEKFFENFKKCIDELDGINMESLKEETGEKQMEILCPNVTKATQCIDRIFLEEYSVPFEDVIDAIYEGDEASLLRLAMNTKNTLADACNEGSQLNRDIKEHLPCYQSIDREEVDSQCKEKARNYDIYKDISDEVIQDGIDFRAHLPCVEYSFQSACMAYAIHEKCGEWAFSTFNTFVRRTTIFQNVFCSKETLEMVRDKIIDRTNMPEAEKNLFKLGLDLKK